jgi:Subtilase family
MKNKLITAVLTLSLLSPIAIAKANNIDAPVLAILDTAIDTSLPELQGKIVGEVCILEWALCPNGTNFQEGSGSASMPSDLITKNGFDHGTFMASAAVKTNPNIKILFVKIIANTPTGLRKPTGESTISAALAWVRDNAVRYNVKAVSLSQGSRGLLGKAGTEYCPTFPRTISAVQQLNSMSIPVFSAVGNNRDYSRIDWPSCIEEVVSIGAVDQIGEIASYSNNDSSLLDFFALGSMSLPGPGNVLKNIAGTSSATQVAAATYLSVSSRTGISGSQLISMLSANSLQTRGRQGTFAKLMPSSLNVATATAPVELPKKVDNSAADKAAADKAAADKAAADKAAADKAAADKAAREAAIKAEVNAGIAAAEAQYAIELKAAQDKLNASRAAWMAKLNG